MNQIIKVVILAAVSLMMLNACAQEDMIKEGASPGVRVDDKRAPYATIRYNTVAILDKSLQRINGRGKIAVESSGARRSPTGTLEAFAVLRNRTDYPLQIEGRVQFFDAQKFPADGPTAWQRVYLPPNSVAGYKELSTQVHGIGYYYIEIREGR